jgi:hypothetical protein
VLEQRGRLLVAALGLAGLPRLSYDSALWALRTWFDSWAGIGRIAVGMAHQGYDLQLTRSTSAAGGRRSGGRRCCSGFRRQVARGRLLSRIAAALALTGPGRAQEAPLYPDAMIPAPSPTSATGTGWERTP